MNKTKISTREALKMMDRVNPLEISKSFQQIDKNFATLSENQVYIQENQVEFEAYLKAILKNQELILKEIREK